MIKKSLCTWWCTVIVRYTEHCCHHAPKVKPEAATAVVELLMMSVRTPETCWAVRKRQVINLGNCCISLVDLLGHVLSTLLWNVMSIRKIFSLQRDYCWCQAFMSSSIILESCGPFAASCERWLWESMQKCSCELGIPHLLPQKVMNGLTP